MRRWLKLTLFLTVFVTFALCASVLLQQRSAHAETVLLLDTSPAKPLNTSKAIWENAPLNMTTVSRAAVYSDPMKLQNLGAYRIVVLYQYSYGGINTMPSWAKTAFDTYVDNGGILIGTGVDEVAINWGSTTGDANFMGTFHLRPGVTLDLMTATMGWTARVEPGQENHPIAKNVYGSYSGQFTTNGFTDCDGSQPGVGCTKVFGLKGWFGAGSNIWFNKIAVWHTADESNDGTTIYWNGNGNRSNTYGEMVGEWTGGVMVPAFQNMMFWAMGLAGYELVIDSDASFSGVGYPVPGIGVNPTPRLYEMTCSVTSPWSYPGVVEERYSCTGWTGDGVVVPASGDQPTVTFTMTDNAWITWHWVKEYHITVTSSQGIGAPGTVFELWHPASTVAAVTTSAFVPTSDPDLAWRLSGWVGTGSVPASGNWTPEDDPTVKFLCSGFGTIEWQWTQTYRLQVHNPKNIGIPSPMTGDTFFDQNSPILATVQDQVYESSSVRYTCIGFDGTGAVPSSGTTNSVTFVFYTPSTITWNWSNEYRLDVLNPSGIGVPSPAEGYYWHPQDAVISCSISSPIDIDGTNYIAVGYYLNGVASYFDNFVNPSVNITMSGPNEIKWIVQPADISLTINSAFGSPTPSVGTHERTFNDMVTLDVEPIVQGDSPGIRYVCEGFTGSGEGVPEKWTGFDTAEGHDFEFTFQIKTNPTVITWLWSTQYLLVVNSTLDNVPATPSLGQHWVNLGVLLNASVPKFIPGYDCDGYFVSQGSLTPSERNYVTFTMTEPTTIVWSWVNRSGSPLFPSISTYTSLTPADPNYGRYCSVVLNPLDSNPRISYYRSYPDGGGSLYYTYYNGVSWITELVDGRGSEQSKIDNAGEFPDSGQYSSIALDSSGRPHIAYFDAEAGVLRYALRTITGNWQIQIVDDGQGTALVGEFCSLSLNNFNEPSIAYYNRTSGNLMYAKLGENGWSIESPAILGNVGSSAKVVLDSVTQRPRIVYRDNESNVLNFVYHNGTEWITIVVDDDGTTGNIVGLTLDSKGMAHIAYQAFLGEVNRLMYAIQSGDSFFKQIIEENSGTGYFPAIGMLPGDFPIIAYNDQSIHALRYTFFDGSKWRKYTIDDNGQSVGWYAALNNVGDTVAITYWTNEGLRYSVLEHKADTSANSNGSSSSGGGGGCFIATAAFGCYAASSVCKLTGIRDSGFSAASTGKSLVALYYELSPAVSSSLTGAGSAVIRKMLGSFVK